uniref:Calcineurin-like phosphoesterase domain-containing protein n=1 Tax=Bicosoecida sp. CB-2014 TaxID=1486930 RepID=A0A7S1C9Z9_9STRA
MDGPAYMKRKVKYGSIDVDLEANSLVVNYEVEAAVLGGHGEVMKNDTKAFKKIIKLKQLNEHSNIPLLAEDVVDKCDLIHEDSLPLVERLLYELQRYQVDEGSRADSQRRIEKEARRKKKEERRARAEAKEREEAAAKEKVEVASMDNIDTYMEMMYEDDINAKVKATALILQLARNVGNLEPLIQNESLLGALSRTLKEEYKKNMDLTINIMHIFFSFSTFSQMHPVLVNFRIGDMCMRVLDLEKKRYTMRIANLEVLTKLAEAQASGNKEEEDRIRTAATEAEDEEEAAGGAGGGDDAATRAGDAAVLSCRILLVSDVHAAVKRVAALAAWCRAHVPGASTPDAGGPSWREGDGARGVAGVGSGQPFLSCVLASGDLADMPEAEQTVLESVGSGEGDAAAVVAGLEDILCRVVYVPGNHDPVSMCDLESPPQLTSHSTSAHNRAVRIAPGLSVVGFGGSVPAYQDGKQRWLGFPYTEDHMRAGLGALLRPSAAVSEAEAAAAAAASKAQSASGDATAGGGDASEADVFASEGVSLSGPTATLPHAPPGDDIILMTHCGPQDVATTMDGVKDPAKPISSGSRALREALLEPDMQARVVCNVHGHTHNAAGQAWLGGVRVINPGSLRYGANFGLLSLRRRDERSRWRVVACEFHSLP